MKKRISLLAFLLLAFGIIISCSDVATNSDEEPTNEDPIEDVSENTVEDDIANIEASIDNTISLLSDLAEGNFSKTVETFFGVSSGNYNSTEWIEEVFIGLENFVDETSIENNHRFDFSAHTGVYEYNHNSGDWSETSSSGSIELKFPSSESSSSNDMAITISEYSDASVAIDGGNYYLPTRIHVQIAKDGEEIFGFYLKDLQYSDNPDLPVPSIVDLEIFTAPFTHKISFIKNSSTNFKFTFGVENNEDLVTALDLELDLAHNDYGSLDEGDLKNISGSLNMTKELKVEFDIESGKLASIDDPSENQINSLINAEVLYSGNSIGELEYSEEQEDILILYKDGTSESTSRYYKYFLEQLETVFFDFTGDWVDF